MKRKQHYNEFYAVKLARKLMENDDDDEDDEDDDNKEETNKIEAKSEVERREVVDSTMVELVDIDNDGHASEPSEKMAVGEEHALGD